MHRDKVILAGYFVRCPLGGYAWQVLHYLVGLRAAGFDPYFYEDTAYYGDCFDPTTQAMHVAPDAGIAIAAEFFERFGFGDRWMFWDAARDRHHGLSASDTRAVLDEARVAITLAAVTRLPPNGPRRRIFIDIDPGFTQIRLADGDQDLREFLLEHDVHCTIGENIGTPHCPIPSGGFAWRPTRQPIALDLWSPLLADPSAAFTTVGRWDEQRRDVRLGAETYAWRKRVEWLKFLDLPARTRARFLVAMDVDKTPGDADLLRAHGWDITDPIAVSRDMLAYRDFIRQSKGEFTVAKDLNVRLATGWFSDRGACYLAAGRPVVTQDTGFGRSLPTGAGLHAVHSFDDAVVAIGRIEASYDAEGHAARSIASQYFDAREVVAELMSAV